MPTVYLSKEAYDEIVRRGEDVSQFLEEAVTAKLKLKQLDLEARGLKK